VGDILKEIGPMIREMAMVSKYSKIRINSKVSIKRADLMEKV
jgi:hypothetical protein